MSLWFNYLKQRIAQGIGPKDPVFNSTYDAMRMFLGRPGKNVLKRHVHPHLFRHSSATYYASKLNRQELCVRFEWKFSSLWRARIQPANQRESLGFS